jgi:RNase P subunit RPR2
MDNQGMQAHIAATLSTYITSRNAEASRLKSLREYVDLMSELSTSAATARKAALKHSGCSTCNGWDGTGSL